VSSHDSGATPAPGDVEQLVRALIAMMRDGGMSELDLTFGDVTVRLRGSGQQALMASPSPQTAPMTGEPSPAAADYAIAAPMIGTFYASPSPGASPFVEVGDTIAAGQVIGIIEAMKIMNEIPADRGGVVTEIVAANGQPVEYGSALIRIRPGDGQAS
jgi:acetyl-CoA carboxylase biotin carboxyl carrier protein